MEKLFDHVHQTWLRAFDLKKTLALVALALWFLSFAFTLFGTSLFVNYTTEGSVDFTNSLISPQEFFPAWFLGAGFYGAALALGPKPSLTGTRRKILFSLAAVWLFLSLMRLLSFGWEVTSYTFANPFLPGTSTTVFYSINPVRLIEDFLDEVSWLMFLYALIFAAPPLLKTTGAKVFLWAFILFAFISVFYTYRSEEIGAYAGVIDFIEGKAEEMPIIKSFYREKNSYAFILLLGLSSALTLNSLKPRWWYLPIEAYLLISILFTSCKTIYIILLIFLPIFFVYRLFVTAKEHPLRNTIVSFISVLVLAAFFISFLVLKDTPGSYANKIVNAVGSLSGIGSTTMDSRLDIWKTAMALMTDPFRLILGYGYYPGEGLAMAFQSMWLPEIQRSTHSGILDVFLRYGIIGVAAFLGCLAYVGIDMVRCAKKGNGTLVIDLALIMILFMMYSLDESKLPFYRDISSVPFLVIPLLPLYCRLEESSKE